MAEIIEITSSSRITAAPGYSTDNLSFTLKNTGTRDIGKLYLAVQVNLEEVTGGLSTGYYTLTQLMGSSDGSPTATNFPAGEKIRFTNRSFSVPAALSEEFAKSTVRAVPAYLYYQAVRYSGGLPAGTVTERIPYGYIIILNANYSPRLAVFEVERGSADGTPADEGIYLLTTLKLSVADDANLSGLTLRLYYEQDAQANASTSPYIDLTAKIPELLTGVTKDPAIIPMTFTNAGNWNFILWFGDNYEYAYAYRSIAEAFANFHLSGCKTGGVCVGGFSTSTEGNPIFECHYPAYFYGGIMQGGVKDYPAVGVEQDTGMKWIDGKPIYRKVFTGTAAQSSNTLAILGNIEDLETVISIGGTCYYTAQKIYFPPNWYYNSNNRVDVYVDGSKNVVARSSFANVVCRIIVEYTKA